MLLQVWTANWSLSIANWSLSIACMRACRVGMLFLPNDDKLAALARQTVEDVVEAEGRCRIVGWRVVPVVPEVVGRLAKVTEPRIAQVCATGPRLGLRMITACVWKGAD